MSRCWLLDRLTEWGDREALVGPDGSVSYLQLVDQARSWAEELARGGVTAGKVTR